MKVLDIMVPVAGLRFVTVATTSGGAEAACDAADYPFTGRELLPIFGVPMTAVDWSAGWTPMKVGDALVQRGAVLVNRSGRIGVSVGYGRVVQPCGRTYALAATGVDWWVDAWRPAGLVTTVNGDGRPIKFPPPVVWEPEPEVTRLILDPADPTRYLPGPLLPDPTHPGSFLPGPLLRDPANDAYFLPDWSTAPATRLVEDPARPGMFLPGELVEDPAKPGTFLPGPLQGDPSQEGRYFTQW